MFGGLFPIEWMWLRVFRLVFADILRHLIGLTNMGSANTCSPDNMIQHRSHCSGLLKHEFRPVSGPVGDDAITELCEGLLNPRMAGTFACGINGGIR